MDIQKLQEKFCTKVSEITIENNKKKKKAMLTELLRMVRKFKKHINDTIEKITLEDEYGNKHDYEMTALDYVIFFDTQGYGTRDEKRVRNKALLKLEEAIEYAREKTSNENQMTPQEVNSARQELNAARQELNAARRRLEWSGIAGRMSVANGIFITPLFGLLSEQPGFNSGHIVSFALSGALFVASIGSSLYFHETIINIEGRLGHSFTPPTELENTTTTQPNMQNRQNR